MGKTVKYILFALLLAGAAGAPARLAAQHYLGVRGGLGGGTTRIYPKEETRTLWGLYNAGVSWKYYTAEKYVGGVQADILFMQQGYINHDAPYDREGFRRWDETYNPGGDSTLYEKRKVNSIMVPLMFQPHIYMFRRNMRIFLNAGVTFSYNINQTQAIVSDSGIEEGWPERKYQMRTVRDNRWGYGLVGGGGIGWSFGRVEVLGEVRYYIGYSDLMRNRNKYRDNPLRSPLDGLQGSVGVYYRFGKKGILSPPSRKMEQKLMELEEKRRQREMEAAIEGPQPADGDDAELPADGEPAGLRAIDSDPPRQEPAIPVEPLEDNPGEVNPDAGDTDAPGDMALL